MTRLTASSDAGVGAGPGDTEPRANITNLTIRWTFAADIKATQAADVQFQCLESAGYRRKRGALDGVSWV